MEATLVHLSDLHFKNDVENRFRIENLRDDLSRLTSAAPIFTLFTGDLIQSGDENTYDILFDELIVPLLELGHEIAVVPGNHDIQRSKATKAFTDSCLGDRGSSYLFNGKDEVKNPHTDIQNDPLSNYSSFEELFGPYDSRSYWGYCRTVGQVSIVGLNSTWLSRERDAGDSDRGKLRIEPRILDGLTQNLPSENLKVAILHHPLDWLEETTRDAVSSLLTERVDIALFGHVHSSDLSNLAKESSSCIFIQSPPLRSDWSKGTNGYSIVRCDISSKKFEVEYRSYSKTRREFVRGEDFAANGSKYPRPEDKEFFAKSPSQVTLLQRFLDSSPFDFTDWHRNNIRAKSKRLGSFIMPKARKVPKDPEDQWLEPAERIGDIVIGSGRDQFFVAPPDSGSTTAAFLVFRQLADTFAEHKRVPAYFDASEQNINKASILRAIHRSSLVRYTHDEVSKLSEAGSVVLIIDGLSLADAEQFNLFRETAKRYFSSVRFVYFLCTERREFSAAGDNLLSLNSAEDDIFEFAELEVSDIRSMVGIWRPGIGQDALDATVVQVVESFRQMDEPIFASSIAVVVETLTQDPEFKPLNKSRLLERYVECLLGRFELEDVREGAFASSDKIDFLSFVSRRILEGNQVSLTDVEWNEISANYQTQYLMELPKGLLEEFIEKGLLTLSDGKITFRGDYLFSFFVARQMKSDPEFAASLLSNGGLFKYYREIVFYGELEGTDTRAVLNSVYVVVGEVEEVLLENYSREGINLLSEWAATSASFSDTKVEGGAFSDAAERLGGTLPSGEAADRFNDSQLAQVQRRRGIGRRVAVQEAEAKLLVAMKLYALLIKNALQLPAADKLRHLEKLYEAAELWVGFLCSLRAEVGTQPVVVAGGILFINLGAAKNPEKSMRDFKFNAPNSISRILAESIRNPQLAVALRHVLPRLNPMGALFVRDALLELPGAENRDAYVKSLLQEAEVDHVTSSLRTLRTRFLASGRSKELRAHIESLVATLERASSSTVGVDFEKLRKARLVRDLKERARGQRMAIK